MKTLVKAAFFLLAVSSVRAAALRDGQELQATVEAEEAAYHFEDADNGAGPMWCSGSTCLARIGQNVFASGLETLPGIKPLNNCRWLLFQRESSGWKLALRDSKDHTCEPSPLVAFPDGRLFLSEEGKPGLMASAPRFQVLPNQRLLLVCYVQGAEEGRAVSENRVIEIRADGGLGKALRLPFQKPFTSYFTATPRGGSPESSTLELLGSQAGAGATISYAQVRFR